MLLAGGHMAQEDDEEVRMGERNNAFNDGDDDQQQ
jgi:hypothetical protein